MACAFGLHFPALGPLPLCMFADLQPQERALCDARCPVIPGSPVQEGTILQAQKSDSFILAAARRIGALS